MTRARSLGLALGVGVVLAVAGGLVLEHDTARADGPRRSAAQAGTSAPPAPRANVPARPAAASSPASHGSSLFEGVDCVACHTTEGWGLAGGGGSGSGGFDHSRTGFPLTGRHRSAACNDCHVPSRAITRDCNGCHQDSHDGRLGQSCDACHSARTWTRTTAFERHRRTRLPLTGMHALADCTECHQRGDTRRMSDVPADCFACHENEYLRTHNHQGNPSATPPVAPYSRDCSICHRSVAWSPATLDDATLMSAMGLTAGPSHELSFPIASGPHRGATCDSCHRAPNVPRAVTCLGCHAHDPLRLRAQHRVAVAPDDAAACLRCHPGGARR